MSAEQGGARANARPPRTHPYQAGPAHARSLTYGRVPRPGADDQLPPAAAVPVLGVPPAGPLLAAGAGPLLAAAARNVRVPEEASGQGHVRGRA